MNDSKIKSPKYYLIASDNNQSNINPAIEKLSVSSSTDFKPHQKTNYLGFILFIINIIWCLGHVALIALIILDVLNKWSEHNFIYYAITTAVMGIIQIIVIMRYRLYVYNNHLITVRILLFMITIKIDDKIVWKKSIFRTQNEFSVNDMQIQYKLNDGSFSGVGLLINNTKPKRIPALGKY